MKGWIQFILFLIAQLVIFRLIVIEYSKYKVIQYKKSLDENTCYKSKLKVEANQKKERFYKKRLDLIWE
jgi:hypothetical protein